MLNFFLLLFFILFALFRTPLFAVISAIAILSFLSIKTDLSAIIIEMLRLANTSTLIAIPLFTFAGYILAESNTPKRLVNLTQALFGWIPGGLALVVLVSCAIFTAFTGASEITSTALQICFSAFCFPQDPRCLEATLKKEKNISRNA